MSKGKSHIKAMEQEMLEVKAAVKTLLTQAHMSTCQDFDDKLFLSTKHLRMFKCVLTLFPWMCSLLPQNGSEMRSRFIFIDFLFQANYNKTIGK